MEKHAARASEIDVHWAVRRRISTLERSGWGQTVCIFAMSSRSAPVSPATPETPFYPFANAKGLLTVIRDDHLDLADEARFLADFEVRRQLGTADGRT